MTALPPLVVRGPAAQVADLGEWRGVDLASSPPPAEATAAEHPCELYSYHAPAVVRTQGHHRSPVYLQNRVYGRIVLPELMWLCGSCHDAVHEWVGWLLAETRRPDPEPGRKAKIEARRTVDWYLAAVASR